MADEVVIDLEYLAKLEDERKRAQGVADDWTERRNQTVLALLDQGTRQNAIARTLDVTPGRVSQLAERARRQRDGVSAAA